jgi:putative ABC transport system permease protein
VIALLDWLRLFSLREVAAAHGRAAASLIVITVSSALLVAVLGLITSIDDSISRLARGIAGTATFEVSGIGDGGIPEAVLGDVERVPGVSIAVPVVQTSVATRFGPTLLLGADARSIRVNGALRDAVSTRLNALTSTPHGVLAGPGMGLKSGEQVAVGTAVVTVAGVLDGTDEGRLNGGRFLLCPLRFAQKLAGRGASLDNVLVVPKAGADHATLRSSITQAVAKRALVTEPQARSAEVSTGVNLVRFVALSAGAFAFVVAGFLIYTALSMSIAQRRSHVSRLRAIGARPALLVAGLLGEVGAYGLIGGAIGAVLGTFIGRAVIGGLPDVFMQTVTARIEYFIPVWAVPAGIVASIVASVAAAAVAARQVYKVTPIEAMVPLEASTLDVVPRQLRVGAFATFVVLAVVAFYIATADLGLIADTAISVMFAALIALGFALGGVLVRGCAAVAELFRGAGAVAASAIRREPRRVWATMMTVAIAVAATLALNGGGANAVDSARDSFAVLGDTDIWVSTRGPGLFPTGPLLPRELRDRIVSIPGVARVSDTQAGYATINGSKVMVYGLGEDSPNPLLQTVNDDVRRDVLAGRGVVVSRDLARRLQLRAGDTLPLQTTLGVRPVRVLASVPFFSGLSGTVGINIDQMRQWFNRPGQTALGVTADPGTDLTKLLGEVRKAVPAGIDVYSGKDAVDGFGRVLRQAFQLTDVIWIVVLVIAALALLNMLTMSILARRREIGVLRAIGSTRRFVFGSTLAEGAAIGLVGGAVGIIFGTVEQYLSDFASSEVWSVDVSYRPVPLAFVLAAGAVIFCVIGSIAPATQAARTGIISAVSNE